MGIVICKLPRAGLGNQLFPLMHALVFSHLNNLPIIIVGYHHFKIGPYLRNEKSKRRYNGYFNFSKNFIFEFFDQIKVFKLLLTRLIIFEPPLEVISDTNKIGNIFYFNQVPLFHDYFKYLRPHRNLVIDLFKKNIKNKYFIDADFITSPIFSVHVRMGDFRKLNPGEEFKGGHVRAPEEYFIDIINKIRFIKGYSIPVKVFTDGYIKEFSSLSELDNVSIVEGNSDMVDLILLSRSQLILVSPGSTFSYWAVFLSDSPALLHPDHIHSRIREFDNLGNPYEGSFNYNYFSTNFV